MTDPSHDILVQPDDDCLTRGHRLGTSAVNDLEALTVCLTCTAVWRVSFEEASHRTTFAEPEAKLEVALRVASRMATCGEPTAHLASTRRKTMTLRTNLEALVATWPYPEAKAALRVADITSGRDDTYWRSRGRERVERELTEDGLPPERTEAVLLTIDDALGPDLDSILADLKARQRLQ